MGLDTYMEIRYFNSSLTGLTQVTGLFYASLSTSAELASYLITLKLVTTISQFSAPFYSKLPKFSGLRVRNKINELSIETMTGMFKSLIVFVFSFQFCSLWVISFNINRIEYKIRV